MYIKGVGMTKFDYSQKPWWQFAFEAAREALEDAKMKISEIEAIVFTGMENCDGYSEHQTHKISLLSDLFKTNVPIIETPSVCAGGGVAFWTALQLEKFKNTLVVSGERLVDNKSEMTTHWILSAAERVIEQAEGMLFPVQNALVWQQYMLKYGATMDDLALIAYKNHQNAVLNPNAYYYQRPVSLEDIKNSPIVASPLRLMDCSLSVNGGAAAILSREKTDIEVLGSGFATDYLLTFSRKEPWHFQATKLTAKQAYQEAKIKPEDIDVAEVHDAFTSVELFSYEDLGLAPNGKGAELIRSGKVNLDGELPINPSGGLKAKGHPISVTGLAQVYEIVNQLRGRCGERQVRGNPKIGLCHNVGGTGGSVTVHILKKIT
ncbi:MAG: acetyl-CoA acetyltransferase [Candidatus Nealsonbacteria bacterium CG10_big_fil_rev_8_21_14_0_10_37_25]|uniref:Acetyl-CoA acetyltransferase n=1 Tax=Candidatus Nealsonbacteria bacterium CG10_big_fil_rev_8_21_14_0_10_37_25 TaxID=1974711 RepID=A0A2H0TIJ7_9BACT|nr:MAG: acetyl-CoA acetyltransferase [Candidatus Nealsonbacteria bacterium CG10_big_fil_rev_8_21_14_0_10_37_25]